ncbi:MAG: nicotinate (nicotinamide) nucleotide adenylyltransferase [Candidatus Izemoplasmatales bacterium]|jgi:nicotinate-nucleotide adenylyltransferase|nr:nicotinate (nicotinamide) nucleotide adenylyltransferase [Candidatus Izemoplasmatales bacterium]MDD3864781.1 nicotinate (nicotinamide) nucleotide adenylyltransferase [Candidatus Izemoplasmatales bacterium]
MIIVFGGAFNPPTIAHKEIYFYVRQHMQCKEFIYLPVSSLYTKRSLASNHHRLEMLKLMTKELPRVKVSTMEFDDPDYLGTYHSLVRIQEQNPGEIVAFIIGADNLSKLPKWINIKGLLAEFKFIVINRNHTDIRQTIEDDPLLRNYHDSFITLPDFHIDVSSTVFRGTLDPGSVTTEVYDYIIVNQLYRG